MKHIAVLGSTGSIGKNTLDVIRRFPGQFRAVALSANANIDILYQQIKEFHPEFVCVNDKKAGLALKAKLGSKGTRLLIAEAGLLEMVGQKGIDQVVVAISGSAALVSLLEAIDKGKDIALANKEALVMAGNIVMQRAKAKKVKVMPIDSEQSAIWQCLCAQEREKLNHIYLTASGGPLHLVRKEDFWNISRNKVLAHPRWKMGKKITVDCATLMNKGLEVLEAMYLFAVPAEKIKIVIHPEAIIHSMVEFVDGVIMAQLSVTDMRIPIQYALSYPQRLENGLAKVDFYRLKNFTFEKPDLQKFPCLQLAYSVARQGGTMPCVLNAANEACVEAFLSGRLRFVLIPKVIANVLKRHYNIKEPHLDDIFSTDSWGRQEAGRVIARLAH